MSTNVLEKLRRKLVKTAILLKRHFMGCSIETTLLRILIASTTKMIIMIAGVSSEKNFFRYC